MTLTGQKELRELEEKEKISKKVGNLNMNQKE